MPTEMDEPPMAFQDQQVYLITDGLGQLGDLFAREILRDTRETTVVVTGRAPFSAEKVDRLSAQSERIRYRQVDVGDADQVARLIDDIRIEHGGLNGIIHCAGALADNFILKKSNAEFRGVLVPKVAGAFHLDQASRDVDLDFFVLFSSFAGAMDNLDQADYATANAFMDELTTYRNGLVDAKLRHGRTRSIHWPL